MNWIRNISRILYHSESNSKRFLILWDLHRLLYSFHLHPWFLFYEIQKQLNYCCRTSRHSFNVTRQIIDVSFDQSIVSGSISLRSLPSFNLSSLVLPVFRLHFILAFTRRSPACSLNASKPTAVGIVFRASFCAVRSFVWFTLSSDVRFTSNRGREIWKEEKEGKVCATLSGWQNTFTMFSEPPFRGYKKDLRCGFDCYRIRRNIEERRN